MFLFTIYKIIIIKFCLSLVEQEKQSELDFASALKQIAMQQEQIAMDRLNAVHTSTKGCNQKKILE